VKPFPPSRWTFAASSRNTGRATAVAYLARCGCGWLGNAYPSNPDGYNTCQQELIRNHLCPPTNSTVADLHHATTLQHTTDHHGSVELASAPLINDPPPSAGAASLR
jgi:hypothetical protein